MRAAAASLRQRTIIGERAMRHAEEDALILIDTQSDEIVRSYIATGLLSAALAELQSGVPKDVAVQTLRAALLALDAPPS